MAQGEFSLIKEYFSRPANSRKKDHTVLGIGDDAAILSVPDGKQLVVTMDTLIAGRHFPVSTNPADIAYKSLAVNVSDLVAMAASPFFFLLSLTLPDADEKFLREFSKGLFIAADEFGITLVGGDTCRGPLSISIQATGLVDEGHFIRRSGAKIGDKIIVSGKLGSAALGLAGLQGKVALSADYENICYKALNQPCPRLDLIQLLRKYASSAIDLSDGLVGDLQHILQSSSVGAIIYRDKIPVFEGLQEFNLFELCLNGGDDYQILFTVAEDNLDSLLNSAQQKGLKLTVIGDIVKEEYKMIDLHNSIDLTTFRGFDHFAC